MKRYWISWWQPTDDPRPVYKQKDGAPLNGRYWESGWRDSDGATSMCAVVEAENETNAKSEILKFWKEAKEWRFCEEHPMDFKPGNRFPWPVEV